MKRYNHRKTITAVLTAAALLMAGCQKQSFDIPSDSDASQLAFSASLDGQPVVQTDGAQPRAAGVDTDLKANGFYLAGYYTTGLIDASAATAVPNIFNKEVNDQQIAVPLVTYTANGNGGKFVLKTIKWALNDITYLSFFGWSQSKPIPTSGITAATTGIIGQTKDDNDKGYPWVDIRNADAPADQTDVVGSRSLDHKNDAVISSVDLDFRHLLSKLTFKAKSSSKANIAITAVNIKYAADKVRKKARYTFGSNAAAIGAFSAFDEYHSGTVALGTTYPAITEGAEVVLGSALLLPQQLAAGDVSIEIKYKLSPNSGDVEGPEQTKILPLAAFTFEQGNNYLYVIDMQATEVFVPSYPIITNWEIVAAPLPVVPGAMDGKTLLLLDGYDKPYIHTDGKAYWLDRSGYNRHCEIVGYGTNGSGYNISTKSYISPNTASNYIAVPAIPNGDNWLAELITSLEDTPPSASDQSAVSMMQGNTTVLSTQISPSNSTSSLTFVSGSTTIDNKSMFAGVLNTLSMLSYRKNTTTMSLFRNGELIESKSNTTPTANITGGKIGANYKGNIRYIKLTNHLSSEDQAVRRSFREVQNRYGIATGVQMPPITSGLVGWYDGYNPPERIDGELVWKDCSTEGNHAQLLNGTTWDSETGSYVGELELIKKAAAYLYSAQNGMTVEIIWRRPSTYGDAIVFTIGETDTQQTYWKSWKPAGSKYSHWQETPGNYKYYTWGEATEEEDVTNFSSWAWAKGGHEKTSGYYNRGYKNGQPQATGASTLKEALQGQSHISFGFAAWRIQAVRIYNRQLSDSEIRQNYDFDKQYYGLKY